jgi:polyhydroxybutyrate depolymerase
MSSSPPPHVGRSAAPQRSLGTRIGLALKRVCLVVLTGAVVVVAIGALGWALLLRSVTPPKPLLSGRAAYGSLEAGGRVRAFLYYTPVRVAPSPALVMVFHSSMGRGPEARVAFGYEFDRLADEHGFVVVYPDAVEGYWNDCRRVAPYAARRLGVDDVGFARALVAHFGATWNVDRQRVFAAGFSSGGQMALRLALEAPDLVAAAAPVIASLPVEGNMACRVSGAPVAILFMNGTDDPLNPYEGGDVELYGTWKRGKVLSGEGSAAWFARLAGHPGPPERETLPDRSRDDGSTVERMRWSAPQRRSVVLYAVRGGGHTVPHPAARAARLLGRTNGDIVAAQEIWSFFSAESARGPCCLGARQGPPPPLVDALREQPQAERPLADQRGDQDGGKDAGGEGR